MMDVSATRSPAMPCTLSLESTTAAGSVAGPILHEPAWWFSGPVSCRTAHLQYSSLAYGCCEQACSRGLASVTLYLAKEVALLSDKAIRIPWRRTASSSGSLK